MTTECRRSQPRRHSATRAVALLGPPANLSADVGEYEKIDAAVVAVVDVSRAIAKEIVGSYGYSVVLYAIHAGVNHLSKEMMIAVCVLNIESVQGDVRSADWTAEYDRSDLALNHWLIACPSSNS